MFVLKVVVMALVLFGLLFGVLAITACANSSKISQEEERRELALSKKETD